GGGATGRAGELSRTDLPSHTTDRRCALVDLEVHLVLAATVVATPANDMVEVAEDLLDLANLGLGERATLAQRVTRRVEVDSGARGVIGGRAGPANGTLGIPPVARPDEVLHLGVEPLRDVDEDRRDVTLPH